MMIQKILTLCVMGIMSCSFTTNAQPTPRNQLTPTPPMGWMTWNLFKGDINEQLIRQTADAMVSEGFAAAGYKLELIKQIKELIATRIKQLS